MQIVSNYNTLGKVGPHYERPEYRPPVPSEAEGQAPGRPEGDRSTLSSKKEGSVAVKKAAPLPTGKISLAAARELTGATAEMIAGLPPLSTTHEPHQRVSSSLMTPVYV